MGRVIPALLVVPCLAAALIAVGCRDVRRPVELGLSLAPGEELRFTQSTSQTIRQSAAGKTFELAQELRSAIRLRVRERTSEGQHIIAAAYEALAISVRSPSGTLAWDSRAPGEGAAALRPLGALVGESFLFVVSDRGVVECVEGLDLLEKRLAESIGAGGWLSGGSAEADLASFFCPFPAGPVAVGESWETERRDSSRPDAAGLGLRVKNRWMLRRRAGARLTIGMASVLDAPGADRPGGNGAGSGAGVSGTQQGTFVVETRTGLVVSAAIDQAVSGTVFLRDLPVMIEIKARVLVQGERIRGKRIGN